MILFKNPGQIDLRGLKTFGLSSKGQDQIGRFGTGLKYATAVIVRNGGAVSIWADGRWNEITTRTDSFRGTDIQHVIMNGDDLPFTTDLGRDWEIWMAFRELLFESNRGPVTNDALFGLAMALRNYRLVAKETRNDAD